MSYPSRVRGKAQEEEKRRIKPNSDRITKIDAAFRQLRTAVLLYFSDQDAVAIHTLALAAHEILRQLAKRKGIEVGLEPSMLVARSPKKLDSEEAKAILSASAAFLKHAGRDPDDFMYFQPDINEHFLYEAVCLYEQMTGKLHPEFGHLKMIVTMRNPALLPIGIPAEVRARWEHNAEAMKKEKLSPANLLRRILKAEYPEARHHFGQQAPAASE